MSTKTIIALARVTHDREEVSVSGLIIIAFAQPRAFDVACQDTKEDQRFPPLLSASVAELPRIPVLYVGVLIFRGWRFKARIGKSVYDYKVIRIRVVP